MELFLDNTTYMWLALMIVFIIIEILTVGLATIWFAGGALIATIVSVIGLPFFIQVIVFFAVSIILLIYTRPLVMKYINSKHLKTNYEGVIGKVVRITEKIDNIAATGVAKIDGQEWTARSSKDDVIIEAGSLAKVIEVSGVKVIVEEIKGEENQL